MAENDEKEYQGKLDRFLNPLRHREAKLDWLWKAFAASYDLKIDRLPSSRGDSQISVLKGYAPGFIGHWVRWRRYMLDCSTDQCSVPGELLLHREYVELAKKEGRALPSTVPPDHFSMLRLGTLKQKVYNVLANQFLFPQNLLNWH